MMNVFLSLCMSVAGSNPSCDTPPIHAKIDIICLTKRRILTQQPKKSRLIRNPISVILRPWNRVSQRSGDRGNPQLALATNSPAGNSDPQCYQRPASHPSPPRYARRRLLRRWVRHPSRNKVNADACAQSLCPMFGERCKAASRLTGDHEVQMASPDFLLRRVV